jgi:hypothetical protein
MKIRSVVFWILLLSSYTAIAQSFEGKILYQTSYKSKIPNIADSQFQLMLGSTMEYMIRNGDYRNELNGQVLQWQLYLNKDNKLYTKMKSSEVIFWNDGAQNVDEVIKATINKGVADILGYKCDELVLECKSGIQKYYYSEKLRLDFEAFASHKFGNFSEFAARAKALPLKMSIETPQFTMETVATEVKPMKLGNDVFSLPADAQLQKSPY